MGYQEIETSLVNGPVKVRFYDGLFIFIVRALHEERKFVGKYLPCRKEAKEYVIDPSEIKEIINDEPTKT